MSEDNVNISDLSINEAAETSKKTIQDLKIDLLKQPPLLGRVIALSSSESDDLEKLGLSTSHLEDLLIEINRYLLASGASIAYGGDLRPNGLTEMFIELVDRYKFSNQDQSNRLQSFLAFPFSISLTKESEAEYAHKIKFTKIPPPDDVQPLDTNTFIPPSGIGNLYIWSRSLTHMRETMETGCHTRIFIGGRATAYKGIAPGVLEELFISLKRKTPLFLIGGYGGVVASVVSHLNGEENLKNILTTITQSSEFQEMQQSYKDKGKEDIMNWPDQIVQLLENGWQSIADLNRLTVEENKILSTSNHVQEIIFYLLKGLVKTATYNPSL